MTATSAEAKRPTSMLTSDDLPALARGCSLLGAGGGGDPRIPLLVARAAIEQNGPVRVLALEDLPDDACIAPVAEGGAPSVGIEKLGALEDADRLREMFNRATKRDISALMAGEIGGANGVIPVAWAAMLRLPVVDADGMGRAFPLVTQTAMEVVRLDPGPAVLCDEHGNELELRSIDGPWMERMARVIVDECGGRACAITYAMTAAEARAGGAIAGTVTRALRIGEVLLTAEDPMATLLAEIGARKLIGGKVVDVEHRTDGGFVRGRVEVKGVRDDSGRTVMVEIQNENLIVTENDSVLASVPDIISLVDSETAEPLHTEHVQYGHRVSVVALAADPLWRTARGLELAGPHAFGYDVAYTPVEHLARASLV